MMNARAKSIKNLIFGSLFVINILIAGNVSAITFSDANRRDEFFNSSQSFSSASESFALIRTGLGIPFLSESIFDTSFTTVYQAFSSPISDALLLEPGNYQLAFFRLAQTRTQDNPELNDPAASKSNDWMMIFVSLVMIGFIVRRRINTK